MRENFDVDNPAGSRRVRPSAAGDVASLVLLVVAQAWAVWSVVLVPLWIADHPLRLAILNGSNAALAACGVFVRAGEISLPAALGAPAPLWLLIGTASWWAGRRFGARAASWFSARVDRSARAIDTLALIADRNRVVLVLCAPLLPLPAGLVYAVVGWRRLPVAAFALAHVGGTLVRSSIFVSVGYYLGERGQSILREVSRLSIPLTVLAVGLVAAVIVARCRSRRGGPGSHPEDHAPEGLPRERGNDQ